VELKKLGCGLPVTVNAERPRKGYFEVRVSGLAEPVISLPGMPRPFTKLRELDLAAAAAQVSARSADATAPSDASSEAAAGAGSAEVVIKPTGAARASAGAPAALATSVSGTKRKGAPTAVPGVGVLHPGADVDCGAGKAAGVRVPPAKRTRTAK
jgi:hypothetical protein